MAESGAIRAGLAFVELFTDDVKMQRGLNQASAKFSTWGKALTAAGVKLLTAGAALATPLLGAAKEYGQMGAEMMRASQQTGVSVESLSKLKYAAEQSGVGMEGLEGGLRKMARSLVEAASGSPKATTALRQLGLSVSDLSKLSPDAQFVKLSEAISKVPNPTERAALAMEIFGKGGAELLPLMNQGAAGINKMMEQATALGLVMTTKDAKAALEFQQRLSDLWDVVKMGVFTIGGALAPVLREIVVHITAGVTAVRAFIDQHRELVIIAGAVAAGLVAAGIALIAVGGAFSFIGAAIGTVLTVFSGIAAVIGAVLSPLGILTAAIIGAGVVLFKFTSFGGEARAYLASVFEGLKKDAFEAFGGIRDALASGNWALAAQIAWAFIKLEWAKGVMQIKAVWLEFKAWFLTIFNDTVYGVREAWEIATNKIGTIWSETVAYLGAVWDAFIGTMLDAWNRVNGLIMKGVNEIKGAWDSVFGDGSFDVGAANKAIDDANDKADADRQAAEVAAERKRSEDLAAKLAEAQKEHEKTLADLAQKNASANAGLGADDAKVLAEQQAKIDALQKQLDAATRTAATGKSNAPAGTAMPKSPFDPDAANEGLNMMAKQATLGTFNSSAAAELTGGSQSAKLVRNTQRMIDEQAAANKHLAAIAKRRGLFT